MYHKYARRCMLVSNAAKHLISTESEIEWNWMELNYSIAIHLLE